MTRRSTPSGCIALQRNRGAVLQKVQVTGRGSLIVENTVRCGLLDVKIDEDWSLQIATAWPRSSGLHTSPITPPPIDRGAEPPRPAKNLKMMKASLLGAHAVTKLKRMSHAFAICNTLTRPKISLKGPMKRGPSAYARTVTRQKAQC